MKELNKQNWAAGADKFCSAGWESGGHQGTMRKGPGQGDHWGAGGSRSGNASDPGFSPGRAAIAVLLSGLLVLSPACGSGGVAEESAPGAVAAGSPSIVDRVKKDIKRGDEVTVTEKNGTVHRLKVSKVDDGGIHGRDSRKKQITVPFDDFHSLAVKRGVIRDESKPHRSGSGQFGEEHWSWTAAKVGVVGAGIAYLTLRGVGHAVSDMSF